jgi:hypothetical protein
LGLLTGVLYFGLNLAVAVGIDAHPDEALSPRTALDSMTLIGVGFVAGLVGLSSRARRKKAR